MFVCVIMRAYVYVYACVQKIIHLHLKFVFCGGYKDPVIYDVETKVVVFTRGYQVVITAFVNPQDLNTDQKLS